MFPYADEDGKKYRINEDGTREYEDLEGEDVKSSKDKAAELFLEDFSDINTLTEDTDEDKALKQYLVYEDRYGTLPTDLPIMGEDNQPDPDKSLYTDRNERYEQLYIDDMEGKRSPAEVSDLEDFFREIPGKIKDTAKAGWEGLKNIGKGAMDALSEYGDTSKIGIYDFDPYHAERYYMALLQIDPTMAEGYKDMYYRRKELEKGKTSSGMTGNMAEKVRQQEADRLTKEAISSKVSELQAGLANGSITKGDAKYSSLYADIQKLYGQLYDAPNRTEFDKLIADKLNEDKFEQTKTEFSDKQQKDATDIAIKSGGSTKEKLEEQASKLRQAVASYSKVLGNNDKEEALINFLNGMKVAISSLDNSAVMAGEFAMYNTSADELKGGILADIANLLNNKGNITYDNSTVKAIIEASNTAIAVVNNAMDTLADRAESVYSKYIGSGNIDAEKVSAIRDYFNGYKVTPIDISGDVPSIRVKQGRTDDAEKAIGKAKDLLSGMFNFGTPNVSQTINNAMEKATGGGKKNTSKKENLYD